MTRISKESHNCKHHNTSQYTPIATSAIKKAKEPGKCNFNINNSTSTTNLPNKCDKIQEIYPKQVLRAFFP
jgi:hypothetical protein